MLLRPLLRCLLNSESFIVDYQLLINNGGDLLRQLLVGALVFSTEEADESSCLRSSRRQETEDEMKEATRLDLARFDAF